MRAKRIWTVQSLLTCFFWNAVLAGILYFVADRIIEALQQWIDPFLRNGPAGLPDDIQSALAHLQRFLDEMKEYLAPAIAGMVGTVTFFLWLFILLQGRGLANRAYREAAESRPEPAGVVTPEDRRESRLEPPAVAEPAPVLSDPQPAMQMLSILQREGRLIDFLQEDLGLYEDGQIGAAVRSIHQGCREALSQYMDLKPVYEQAEGEEIQIQPDFDTAAVRLTGNIVGSPPFKGILRHRGWKVVRAELPQAASPEGKDWILAPAEVEIYEENR